MKRDIDFFDFLNLLFKKKYFIIICTSVFFIVAAPVLFYNKTYRSDIVLEINSSHIFEDFNKFFISNNITNIKTFNLNIFETLEPIIKGLKKTNFSYFVKDINLDLQKLNEDEVNNYFKIESYYINRELSILSVSVSTKNISKTKKVLPVYLEALNTILKKNVISSLEDFIKIKKQDLLYKETISLNSFNLEKNNFDKQIKYLKEKIDTAELSAEKRFNFYKKLLKEQIEIAKTLNITNPQNHNGQSSYDPKTLKNDFNKGSTVLEFELNNILNKRIFFNTEVEYLKTKLTNMVKKQDDLLIKINQIKERLTNLKYLDIKDLEENIYKNDYIIILKDISFDHKNKILMAKFFALIILGFMFSVILTTVIFLFQRSKIN